MEILEENNSFLNSTLFALKLILSVLKLGNSMTAGTLA